MRLPDVSLTDIAVIGTYAAALWLPGAVVAAAAGVRRWQLVTLAPLFTYALAGLAGPLYAAVGLHWSALSFLLGAGVVAALVLGARLLLHRRSRRDEDTKEAAPGWSVRASIGVTLSCAAAFVAGIVAILGGIVSLSALPQDWDAAFHANGIRLILDTGDGGLFAMGRVNWYEGSVDVFYPNAYHLLAAVTGNLTGAGVPTVLNAHTVLIPGLIGLSLIGLIHRMGGSPVLAGASALAAVSTSAFYDMLWRGPLLPFATGVALTPLAVVLLLDVLDARDLRALPRPILLLALGAAGLLCLHPAILIGAVFFSVPVLVWRWWQRPRSIPRALAGLVVAGAVAVGLSLLQLRGSLSSAGNLDSIDWPADLSTEEAIGQLLTFSHAARGDGQWGLVVALVLGLATYRRLGDLRWIGVPAAIFGALFVIAASSDAPWANSITSLWWNDRWRLVALAALPLCVVMGHGVAESVRRGAAALRSVLGWIRVRSPRVVPTLTSVVAALVVIAAFGVLTNGLYIGRDQFRMTENVGEGPAVSPTELDGMIAAAAFVPPGSRVLNDRGDGSAWMYALTGLRPVAGHYDASRTGPDAALLSGWFRDYEINPAVREAVRALDIHYVMINNGFLRRDARREGGLRGLDDAPFLRVVYRNPDVVLYAIDGTPAVPASATPVLAEEGTAAGGSG